MVFFYVLLGFAFVSKEIMLESLVRARPANRPINEHDNPRDKSGYSQQRESRGVRPNKGKHNCDYLVERASYDHEQRDNVASFI